MTTIDMGLVLLAYLFGSVSSAIIVCKVMRLPDPRTQGSGNPGATNVLRIGGKKAAALTLVGDFLKGTIPVLIARSLELSDAAISLVAFAAFLGHIFPVFFRFQGGKGVATAFGVLVAWNFWVCLAVTGTWLLMASVFRYSSLAALTGFALAPVYFWLMGAGAMTLATMSAMSAIMFWRHRSNIRNLIAGKEKKIGYKEPSAK